jgi:hypothetical protein
MPLALSCVSGDASGNAFDLRGDSVSASSCGSDIRVLPLDLFTSFRSNHSSASFRLPMPLPALCGDGYVQFHIRCIFGTSPK